MVMAASNGSSLNRSPLMKLASDQTLPSDLKATVHSGDYARRFKEIVL